MRHLSWLWTQGAFYAITSSWLCFILGFCAWSRKHQCHQAWCWRLSRHKAGHYEVCRKHFELVPNKAPKADHIHRSHAGERLT